MQIIRNLTRVLLWFSTLSGIAMTLFVALSAVMRYFVGKPFGFTEELVGLLFAALVFLSFPFVSIAGQNISITILTDLYSGAARTVSDTITNILTIIFSLWFGYFALEFCLFSFELNSRSDLAGILLWPWMSLMPLAFMLVALISFLAVNRRPSALFDAKE